MRVQDVLQLKYKQGSEKRNNRQSIGKAENPLTNGTKIFYLRKHWNCSADHSYEISYI